MAINKGKRLRFNLGRDLLLLQGRSKNGGVFHRRHPAVGEVAQGLVTLHSELFPGLSKKSARNRLKLVLEQHRKRRSRKQSPTDEQNTEKTRLSDPTTPGQGDGSSRTTTNQTNQTDKPFAKQFCKTVFVDSQQREAASCTLTQSDKDSVLTIPKFRMQTSINSVNYCRMFVVKQTELFFSPEMVFSQFLG